MRFSSAEVNQQSKLLSDLQPYSYGQGSVSDDIAQQVTPHKIQKIVPSFSLPSASVSTPNDNEVLTHSVSDGDLAFTIKLVHDRPSRIKNYNFFAKQNITRAVDVIANLPTLNYLLRGLQTDMGANSSNWQNWLSSTGWPPEAGGVESFRPGHEHHYKNLSLFLQDYVRPLGVVIGSENQGGQHQGDNRGAVDFPVDYVVTILVDGLCDNLVNLWKRAEIKAGDDLLLVLAGTQLEDHQHEIFDTHTSTTKLISHKEGLVHNQFNVDGDTYGGLDADFFAKPFQRNKYVLNHYAKGKRTMMFEKNVALLYEIVPTTSSEIEEGYFLGASHRNRGMWHVARSQVQARRQPVMDSDMQTFRNDNANMMGGALLQATIAPVWKSAPRVSRVQHHASSAFTGTVKDKRVQHDVQKQGVEHGEYHRHAVKLKTSIHDYTTTLGKNGKKVLTIAQPVVAKDVVSHPDSFTLEAEKRAMKRRGVEGMVDVWSSNAVDTGPPVVQRAAATAAAAASATAAVTTTTTPTTAPATTSAPTTSTTNTSTTKAALDDDRMQVDDGDTNTRNTTAAAPKVYAQSISMNSGVSQSRAVSVAKVAAKKK
jgi:hypothetical protein